MPYRKRKARLINTRDAADESSSSETELRKPKIARRLLHLDTQQLGAIQIPTVNLNKANDVQVQENDQLAQEDIQSRPEEFFADTEDNDSFEYTREAKDMRSITEQGKGEVATDSKTTSVKALNGTAISEGDLTDNDEIEPLSTLLAKRRSMKNKKLITKKKATITTEIAALSKKDETAATDKEAETEIQEAVAIESLTTKGGETSVCSTGTVEDKEVLVSSLVTIRDELTTKEADTAQNQQRLSGLEASNARIAAAAPTDTAAVTDEVKSERPLSALEARRARKQAQKQAEIRVGNLSDTDAVDERNNEATAPVAKHVTQQQQHERQTEAMLEPSCDDAIDTTAVMEADIKAPISAAAARRIRKLAEAASAAQTEIMQTLESDRIPGKIFNQTEGDDVLSDLMNVDEANVLTSDISLTDDDDREGIPTPISESAAEDTTTEIDESIADETDLTKAIKKSYKLNDPYSVSTYSSENVIPFQHEGETCFCIAFRKNERLVFLGYALIGTLFGSVQINGATISSTFYKSSHLVDSSAIRATIPFYPVFSPRSSALTVVQSIPYEQSANTPAASTALASTFPDLSKVLTAFQSREDTFESIIIVKDLSWCGAHLLEELIPNFKNLFQITSDDVCSLNDSDFYQSIPYFQPIVEMTPAIKAMKIQPSWSVGLDQLLEFERDNLMSSASVICGTKNSGKSTFARYMINRLLNVHQRVAYLETDLGQTEFTPSGLVALHIIDTPILGPNFTHPHMKPIKSFYLGSASPKKDITYYTDCIYQLIQSYHQERDNNNGGQLLPLVVNTHGWTKGFGYDTLFTIIEAIVPSHIFSFACPAGVTLHSRNLPHDFMDKIAALSQPETHKRQFVRLDIAMTEFNLQLQEQQQQQRAQSRFDKSLSRMQPATTLADKYQPTDFRHLMFASFIYHDCEAFGRQFTNRRSWWRTSPRLVERIPYSIDWRNLSDIYILFEEVPPSQILHALNGSVVGLLGKSSEAASVQEEPANGDHDMLAATENSNESVQSRTPIYKSAMSGPPPNPYKLCCYGLGVIRSIDSENRKLHILTPLTLDRLQHVTCLVKGDIDLPIYCMLDKKLGSGNGICHVPWRQVPYLSEDVTGAIGSAAAKVRRNLMRRSQQS